MNFEKRVQRLPLLLLFLSLFLSGCGADEEQNTSTETPHPTVTVREIGNEVGRTFTVTGEALPEREATFIAEFRAYIDEIYMQPGEQVRAGDLIATLSAPNIDQRFLTAATAYTTAALSAEQTRLNAEKIVQSAEAAFKTAETNLENLMNQNAARKNQAKEIFTSAETGIDNTILGVHPKVESAIAVMDTILEATPRRRDNDYIREIHIGVRDPSQTLETRLALESFVNKYQPNTSPIASNAARIYRYEAVIETLQQVESLLADTLTVLHNSVTSPDYPQTQLDNEVTDINNQLLSIRTAITELTSSNKTYKNYRTPQSLVTAEATYKATLAELESAEEQARRRVEEAKLALEQAKTNAKITSLGADSTLTAISGDFRLARIDKDKLAVHAPFNGTLADIPVRVGMTVQPGDLIARVHDATKLKITAYLSLAEAQRIHVGDTVQIGTKSKDVITAIASSADPLTRKYKVEILHTNAHITPGEFVPLTFTTILSDDSSSSSIVVPITAIHIQETETFVWGIESNDEGDHIKKVPVTIGEIQGTDIEIIEGLADGDIIVISGGRILEGEGTEVTIERHE